MQFMHFALQYLRYFHLIAVKQERIQKETLNYIYYYGLFYKCSDFTNGDQNEVIGVKRL